MAKQTVEKVTTIRATVGNGIEVEYEPGPHTYRVRKDGGEWQDVIGVTTALDVLNKGGLPWWGMQQGIQSMLTEWDRGRIRLATDGRLIVFGESSWEVATKETVTALFTRDKLTVNHIRDEAGDRGDEVHKALEQWIKDRTRPVPEFYVDEFNNPLPSQGYIRGLNAFLDDLEPAINKATPLSEVMVASYEHGYAGRYDMEAVLHGARLLTRLPSDGWPKYNKDGSESKVVKGPVYTTFEGRTLFDLKTPKGVYASHHVQMALYEGARLEDGMQPTKHRIVVRVTPDGRYEAVRSVATLEDGLNVLATARSIDYIERIARNKEES